MPQAALGQIVSVESRGEAEMMLRGLGMGFAGVLLSWLSVAVSLSRAPAQVLVQMCVQEVGRLCSFQKALPGSCHGPGLGS